MTLSPEAEDSLLPAFERINVECISLGLSRMAGFVFGAGRMKKLLRKNPADLIHTSDYRSVLLSAFYLRDIPRIVTCRQAFESAHYRLHGGIHPIAAHVIPGTFEMACRRFERIVAVSDSVRLSAHRKLSVRMDVIHNGVDQELFTCIEKEKTAAIKSKLDLPEGKHIFLTSGLSERKDPLTVIKAFLLSRLNNDAILILLGDGTLREQCVRLVGGDKRVRIIGFVRDVKDYLLAADTFISASLGEGCPNAVMEAMACGLPVILSDIPPHREILAFNETAGLIFAAKDAESLAKALSKSRNMNYSECSSAALSIISNHLNARTMSLQYQQLYKQMLEKRFVEV